MGVPPSVSLHGFSNQVQTPHFPKLLSPRLCYHLCYQLRFFASEKQMLILTGLGFSRAS